VTRKVYHFYGMTTACMGLPERDFVDANSRPSHSWNDCLRLLRERHGVESRIYLYTEGPVRRSETANGLEWVFVPATLGRLYGRFFPGRILRKPHYQFSIPFLREIEDDPPDLFVFYGNVPTPFSVLIARRLARMGVPYAVTVHTRLANLFARDVTEGFSRRLAAAMAGASFGREAATLFGGAAAVILLTEADRAVAIERELAPKERIHVIPSSVNGRYFHPGPDAEKDPYPSLCFVGRMEDAKGFLEAVRCLAAVRAEHPAARLHVAGAWTSEAYMQAVQAFIEERGLGEAVVLHGWLGPEELGDLYRRSHLLLFPSKREGLPRAVIEAMMCGVPPAAILDTGGHGDLIVDGVNGLLAPADAWEGEVVRALGRRESLREMALAAARSVEGIYSTEAMTERVEGLYLRLINRGT
jgi:glycosyltransferase involved in cell wall biosynthesis